LPDAWRGTQTLLNEFGVQAAMLSHHPLYPRHSFPVRTRSSSHRAAPSCSTDAGARVGGLVWVQNADAFDRWRRDAVRGIATRSAGYAYQPAKLTADARQYLQAKVCAHKFTRTLWRRARGSWLMGVLWTGRVAAATWLYGPARASLYV
jgi:hypothetical protein